MITHDAITARRDNARARAEAAASEAREELDRITDRLARDETGLTSATFRLAAHATALAQHAAAMEALDDALIEATTD